MTAVVTEAVTEDVTPGVTSEWLGVTAAAQMAGVSKRTVRRWIAENRVVSRLETRDGLEQRFVRCDTLPAITGDITPDDTGERLSPPESSAPRDDTGDSTGDDTGEGMTTLSLLVDTQAAEIAFLRAQLLERAAEIARRDQAEAELRRLMAALTETNRHLTGMLEVKALPPISSTMDQTPKRVRWWWPWRK